MISDIRSYIDTIILSVDPTMVAWEGDLFGNNDESKPRSEKYYNLIIGNNSPTRESNSFTDNIDISLDIFTYEQRDLIGMFDAVYDKAMDIKNQLTLAQNYNNIFNDIEFTLAEPIESDDNDNSIKIRLNFTVRLNYTC